MTTQDKSGEKAKHTGGRRTPRLITFRATSGKQRAGWRMTNWRWAIVAKHYCPAFRLAMLAVAADDAAQEVALLKGADDVGLSERRMAEQKAKRAAAAFADLARKNEVAANIAAETEKGRRWRAYVERITLFRLEHEPLTQTAPKRAPAVQWLDDIANGASRLAKTIEQPPDPLAHSMARADLERNLYRRDWGEGAEPLRELLPILRAVEEAARIASADMSDEVTINADNWARDRWLAGLREYCRREGLLDGAKSELLADGSPSAFVGFVMALERTLPRSLRSHKLTVGATANAIGEATNRAKARVKAREDGEVAAIEREQREARTRKDREIEGMRNGLAAMRKIRDDYISGQSKREAKGAKRHLAAMQKILDDYEREIANVAASQGAG